MLFIFFILVNVICLILDEFIRIKVCWLLLIIVFLIVVFFKFGVVK